MSQTTTVTDDITTMDDAKAWIKFFIGQEARVVKLVVTKNGNDGNAYKGERTLTVPPQTAGGTGT